MPEADMFVPGATCSTGFTVRLAVRVWVPWPLFVLVKVMVALYVPGVRLLAFALTVKVTGVPAVVAVPELIEGVSQVGTFPREKLTFPLVATSV
jgi:hypothetical protein